MSEVVFAILTDPYDKPIMIMLRTQMEISNMTPKPWKLP